MKRIVLSIILLSVILLTGCSGQKFVGRGSLPLLLNNPPTKVEVIRHFTETKFRCFNYSNIYDVSDILSEFIANNPGADAITNIQVEIYPTFGSVILDIFTLGFAAAVEVGVTGDFVRLPKGFGDLIPAVNEIRPGQLNFSDDIFDILSNLQC